MRSLRTYGSIFLCLALLSGCASIEGERSGFFTGADSAAPDAVPDATERSGFFTGADSAAPDTKMDKTARGQDWIRFRPDATSPFSGVEQPHPKPYTGQVSFLRGMYDPTSSDQFQTANGLTDIDGYGLWISARPSEWYIAPELGFIGSAEDNGDLGDIRFSEFFAGGRVVAELPFTPASIIAGFGISSLKADVDSLDTPPPPVVEFDEEAIAPYFHVGVLLHMGDNAHLGLDYRTVDYGDDLNPLSERMDTLSIMAGVNW
ncbi:MAG: hypothetical protein VX404_07220 [Planctomycetota bacterium]|nr:hypothetical protein [Planctomycetota bacterium]